MGYGCRCLYPGSEVCCLSIARWLSPFRDTDADVTFTTLRAQVLFYIQAAALISEVSGLPIGSALLKKNGYWMPALLGLSISTLSCVLLIWLPTVSKKTNHHIAGGVEEITETSRTGLSEGDTSPHSPKSSIQPHQSLGKRLLRSIKSRSAGIVEVLKLVFTNPTLCIGFLSLAATNGIVSVTSFLPQFVSKRFGWTIGDVSTSLLSHNYTSITPPPQSVPPV